MFCLSVLSHFLSFSLPCTRSSHSSSGSHSRQACIIPPLSPLFVFFFLLNFSDSGCYSSITATILGAQSSGYAPCVRNREQVGVFECFFARSEATCLWHLSLSLSVFLLLTSLSSCLLWLGSRSESAWSRLSVPTGSRMLGCLCAAACKIVTLC